MNRIVKEHYPASKLPEDLRADLPKDARVTVEVTAERTLPVRDIGPLVGTGRNVHGTEAEVIEYLTSLRDE